MCADGRRSALFALSIPYVLWIDRDVDQQNRVPKRFQGDPPAVTLLSDEQLPNHPQDQQSPKQRHAAPERDQFLDLFTAQTVTRILGVVTTAWRLWLRRGPAAIVQPLQEIRNEARQRRATLQ